MLIRDATCATLPAMSLAVLLDLIAPPLCIACSGTLSGEAGSPLDEPCGAGDAPERLADRRTASAGGDGWPPLMAGERSLLAGEERLPPLAGEERPPPLAGWWRGEPLGRPPDGARLLCGACRGALPWLRGACCPRCALPLARHARCPAARFAFDVAWAPLAHEGPARRLVGALKHHGRLPAADAMAAAMARRLPADLPDGTVLVPVPAHPGRARRRGVDHAGVLANRLARGCGLTAVAALRRRHVRGEPPQAGAARDVRLHARPHIVLRGHRRPPLAVLLIDDVHTTGATLHACAHALRDAGAEWVGALTCTRAL